MAKTMKIFTKLPSNSLQLLGTNLWILPSIVYNSSFITDIGHNLIQYSGDCYVSLVHGSYLHLRLGI